mgnify:FL=1
MIKLQKITAIMVMAVIALGAISALVFNVAVVAACTTDADCTATQKCTNSACVAKTSATGPLTPTELGIEYGAATGLGQQDIRTTIASIISVAMGLLGIVAVVIILIGGFTWMTAGGNEEKVGEAKKWIFAGVIGLAIILSAYALANFVINSLVGATTGTSYP